MHSLTPEFLTRIQLGIEHVRTLQAIGQYKGRQELHARQAPQILAGLKRSAIIESTESSNRIEGIVASRHDIQQIVLKNRAPAEGNRDEQELAGYSDALNLIHESAADMPFTLNTIRQLHSMIYGYLPDPGGEWKATNNDIVEKDSEGRILRVRFKTVPAHMTDIAMRDLMAGYKGAVRDNVDPLILIPLVLLDFLCIHPFRDGNGRTVRLMGLLMLYHAGYEVGHYISLERVIEDSKDSYYETLEASSKRWHQGRHDPMPWITYFWGTLIKAYKDYEERVGSIKGGKGSKTELIRQAVRRRMGPFTISEIEDECPGISREMVRRVLRQMRDEGELSLKGSGPAARWKRV